jgi:hypothetical protein
MVESVIGPIAADEELVGLEEQAVEPLLPGDFRATTIGMKAQETLESRDV